MENDPTLKIAQRRNFVNIEVEKLKRELETYLAELAELDVADRVYKRFSGAPAIGAAMPRAPIPSAEAVTKQRFGSPQEDPESESSGPTLPEMVFAILEEAKSEGRKGVDSSEMLRIIQARWKPDFSADKVRPTLWRMVQRKRLRKRGRLYSKPEESETVVSSAELARH